MELAEDRLDEFGWSAGCNIRDDVLAWRFGKGEDGAVGDGGAHSVELRLAQAVALIGAHVT